MNEQLIRLESKIDVVLWRLDQINGKITDHEVRVRNLEKWRYALPVATVGMLLTFLVSRLL